MRRDEVEALLREVCCRRMWRAVQRGLEAAAVDEAMRSIPGDDTDASPFGELFALAVEFAQGEQGEGTFITVYDEAVTVGEAPLDDVCVGPGSDAFGQMRRLGYRKKE